MLLFFCAFILMMVIFVCPIKIHWQESNHEMFYGNEEMIKAYQKMLNIK